MGETQAVLISGDRGIYPELEESSLARVFTERNCSFMVVANFVSHRKRESICYYTGSLTFSLANH
jgi:hypothetical protein